MPARHAYEYAVIRVVPRVERGEFVNVGVILFCPSQGFLRVRYALPDARLQAFAHAPDPAELAARLEAFGRICAGQADGGLIGEQPRAARFRWLTAARSTVVQTSPVHPGLCTDPADTLTRLFAQLVQ